MTQDPENPRRIDPDPERAGRQPRARRTRRRILEAALGVLAERGAGALTYRAVAERAQVSLGVTSYHFPSRRELLAGAFALHLELVGRRGRDFEAASGADFLAGALGPDEAAERMVDFLAAMAREERESVVASRELSLALTRDPELASRVEATLAEHRRASSALVARVSGAAPESDAAILSAVLDELALAFAARPDDPALRERARRILTRLVRALFRAAG